MIQSDTDNKRKGISMDDMANTGKLLTLKEACSYLRISESTIRRYIKDGMIPIVQPRKKIYIAEKDLIRFINKGRK